MGEEGFLRDGRVVTGPSLRQLVATLSLFLPISRIEEIGMAMKNVKAASFLFFSFSPPSP